MYRFCLFYFEGEKLHSGFNFEVNLYNDDALQYCKGSIKYRIEGSGPVFSPSFGMALIFTWTISHTSS